MPGVLSRNSLEHAVAGSAGTVVATLLLFPLERLKTLLQVSSLHESLWDVLQQVLQLEGPMGLYRGCFPMLQTVGTSQFLYFFLFEGFKAKIAGLVGQPDGVVGPYESLLSSALAGSLNMAVTEPLWRSCVVVQASSRAYSFEHNPQAGSAVAAQRIPRAPGVFSTVRRMWQREGPRALWRGLGSSLWLVSNPVIQFFAYDGLKGLRPPNTDITTIEAIVLGAIAKALATFATFPLQVAQSKLRACQETARGHEAGAQPEMGGMIACLRNVLAERGIRGLYFGLWPKLLQTVTQAALMFAIYEKIHFLIRHLNRRAMRRTLPRNLRKLASQSAGVR